MNIVTTPAATASAGPPRDPATGGFKAAYAWFVVAVLALANCVSFIDRLILSLLVQPIKAELGNSQLRIFSNTLNLRSLRKAFEFADIKNIVIVLYPFWTL